MDLKNLIRRIDNIRGEIEKRRPLTSAEAEQLRAFYRVDLTYTSNALEGNSLTLTETKVLLEDGLTVSGRPIKDCYEAEGHAEAFDHMLAVSSGGDLTITEETICTLHRLFYKRLDEKSAGVYRSGQVIITGTEYVPPAAEEVPALMRRLAGRLNDEKTRMHPVLLAAFVHRRLVDIHPFADGNGRTARLLMNLILVNNGYQIVSIPPVLRAEYIDALKIAQRAKRPSSEPFNELILNCEIEAQKAFCRLFHIDMKPMQE
ncbi:MAG: Fic family protein [Clostridiales bacterium]|nr:Fic family protein [Clostridiales bacterium]